MSLKHLSATRALGLAALAGLSLAAAPAALAAAAATGPTGTANDYVPAGTPAPMSTHDVTDDVADGVRNIGDVHVYPLAGSPLDLLSNNVKVPFGQGALSTAPVTERFRNGLPLREVPVVGTLLP